MSRFLTFLTLPCALVLLARPARAVEVPLVDALDGSGNLTIVELNGGTLVSPVPIRGLPTGTFLREVGGIARDPRTGDLFMLAIPGPRFGSIPDSEQLRLIRVADDGALTVLGPVLPNRVDPSRRLKGFAIDDAGFGYALQRTDNGLDYDRVAYFRLDDPATGGELNPGFLLNAIAFHGDQSLVYAFGVDFFGNKLVRIRPDTPAPVVLAQER